MWYSTNDNNTDHLVSLHMSSHLRPEVRRSKTAARVAKDPKVTNEIVRSCQTGFLHDCKNFPISNPAVLLSFSMISCGPPGLLGKFEY